MTDRPSAAMSKSTGAHDPLIGRVISDRFRINALIARGGMGKVYRAEQSALGRVCALKVLNPNYAGEHDPEFHRRFFLEASIASKLTHPNTVTIFDYGRTEDDIYYMAMEYLEGVTLHKAIRQAAYFPEDRVAHISRQICRALREAHSLGVIHRDLKPANIFLVEHGDETDFVKVLDFGLVKNVSGDGKADDITQTGLFMGSPKYMSPEQIRGDKVDARTDIYALGIIMYEMITGKVPFDRPNSVNILMAHVNEEPPRMRQVNPVINLSPAIEATVLRAMAKDPDQRFRSMDEVLAALKRAGGGALTGTFSGIGTGEYSPLSATGSGSRLRYTNGRSTFGTSSTNFTFLSGSERGDLPSLLAVPADAPGFGAPLESRPPGRTGLRRMFMVAVFGALAMAAGIVGYMALRPPRRSTPIHAADVPAGPAPTPLAKPTPTQAPTPSAVASTEPPAPTAPFLAKVRVSSDPPGASVKEDGVELCNSTPCDILYKGADADPTREHKLTVLRYGFRLDTRVVTVGDSPINIKLIPAPTGLVTRPQSRSEIPTVPTGYKQDIPY